MSQIMRYGRSNSSNAVWNDGSYKEGEKERDRDRRETERKRERGERTQNSQ
ncbi:hypothetical protein DPMN_124518 [Dreissena polymorpha]|uniref:Uncharacterized protein n=1 Tax=Dreissena polymorpha TaxID=45954 RepID=A0A9D4GTJ8_DREPO|nr:hypothetical protein DPMN_124518 [Dreissena polymorpha]